MSMKPEVRARIRAEMGRVIASWRTSGESRRVWATRHGVSLPKFDYWVRQLAPGAPRGPRRTTTFAPVAIAPPVAAPGEIEIVLARGDRLVVRAGADAALVRTVLVTLASRC
jgi:hypothetical protein